MPEKISNETILAALGKVQEPELHRDLVTLNMIRDLESKGSTVNFTILLTTPACPLRSQIEREAKTAVLAIPGVEAVNVKMDASVPNDGRMRGLLNLPIRNAIAVASGKGGVGKSTVAVNLAVALVQSGARVGLMDADIYGPNIPTMMGVKQIPGTNGEKLVPAEAYGVKLMSMGFLVKPGQPLIWRGPMLNSAIRQFLSDVDWGELDYLIVDLPPGTGDVQMTLAQKSHVDGAIVVSTPQDVALLDARKGIDMFQQLKVPVLGLIENMSTHICSNCGHEEHIFGHGGVRAEAERLGVPLLAEIPLHLDIRIASDGGAPIVVSKPESAQAQSFRQLARDLIAQGVV